MKKLKPIDFSKVYPWSSVFQKSENESLACSIMSIKNDSWDNNPTYSEYLEYRNKLNADHADEKDFDKVNKFCKSQDTAILFSKSWEEITK